MQPVSPVTNTTSITGRNGTVLPSAPKTGVASAQGKVEGGSTGQGHLSEKDCDEIAGFINEHNDWADRFIAEGEVGSALYQLGEAEEWENVGLGGGCFFTNVPV